MAEIQNTDNMKYWQGCGATETLIYCWKACKMVQLLRKAVWQCLKQISMTIQPSNCTPGHLSQRNENYVHTKAFMQMFIATLFVLAPNWKQPRYLSQVHG